MAILDFYTKCCRLDFDFDPRRNSYKLCNFPCSRAFSIAKTTRWPSSSKSEISLQILASSLKSTIPCMRNKTTVGKELTEKPDFRNMKHVHFIPGESESEGSKSNNSPRILDWHPVMLTLMPTKNSKGGIVFTYVSSSAIY